MASSSTSSLASTASPSMVPVGIVQEDPEQLAGEKAAQTSMVLGIIGLVCNFIVSWWSFGLPSLDPGCYWYLQGERGRALRHGCFGWSHHELD